MGTANRGMRMYNACTRQFQLASDLSGDRAGVKGEEQDNNCVEVAVVYIHFHVHYLEQ